MFADSAIVLARACRPRSFTALMTLYESSYVRLRWLLPALESLRGEYVSTVPGDLPLHVLACERSRYTTTLLMTYYFDEAGQCIADPDLRIRVYHDARLAEAMACGDRRRHEALTGFDTRRGSELERRWARNVMLNKWLEYCADREHRFAPAPAAGGAAHRRFVT